MKRTSRPEPGGADECRERACRLLSLRPHSRSELEDKLVRRGFPRPAVALTLDQLERTGLVDDGAFARAYVESRRRGSRCFGRIRLRSELRRRGIDPETIALVLAETDDDHPDETELTRAAELARSRRLPPAGTPEAVHKNRARLYRFLSRRGFAADICRRAIEHIEHGSDADCDSG